MKTRRKILKEKSVASAETERAKFKVKTVTFLGNRRGAAQLRLAGLSKFNKILYNFKGYRFLTSYFLFYLFPLIAMRFC